MARKIKTAEQTERERIAAEVEQISARDFAATEMASKTVRWFSPADWDMADTHENFLSSNGWFYKSSNERGDWVGPFNTSTDAATAQGAQ